MKVILQIIVIALLSISAGEAVATEEAPFEWLLSATTHPLCLRSGAGTKL
jgi:hypothetical protein